MGLSCSVVSGLLVMAGVAVCVPCAPAAQKAPSSWGKTMYVGDSITHGVNSGSWRWAMHKILVDGGISYEAVGYMSGNFQNAGVGMAASYGGVPFANVHSAQASARTWELCGRKAGGRYNNTNISNWLGLSKKTTNGGAYNASVHKPQTFLLLIGTNDLLSDGGPFPSKYDALLGPDRKSGDMKAVLDAMFKSNPKAKVTILSVPCWTRHANNNDAAPHRAVATYNDELKKWVKAYNSANKKHIRLVDVNPGILDVSSATPFYGCESMFNTPGRDGLHPNAHGDLLMAGHVARALGYAGRSVGLPRKDGAQLEPVKGKSASWSAAPTEKGFCAEMVLTFGDGAAHGWDPDAAVELTVGDGSTAGTLTVKEFCVQWGGAKLYSLDMGTNKAPLRVAFTPGNAFQGVARGYYVWLGDLLIGEALPAASGKSVNGVEVVCPADAGKGISRISMAPTAYAPASPLFYDKKAGFVLTPSTPPAAAKAEGDIPEAPGATKLDAPADGKELYASKGTGSGAVDATVSAGVARSWSAVHSQGTRSGNATLRLKDSFAGGSTVMGVVNADKVTGDVGLELSAPGATYGSFTGRQGSQVSVLGAYKASIDGTLRVQVNSGTFSHAVMGGVHTAPGSIKAVELFINGGSIRGNVYGGGFAGSVGSASVTMTGGDVAGGVFGGDATGGSSIQSDTQVDIKGGTIRGMVCGGAESSVIPGCSHVTIHGSGAQLMGNSILAGSAKGNGKAANRDGAILTLRGVRAGGGENGIDRYKGVLGGGCANGRRVLELDDVQADLSAAQVRDFDAVRMNGLGNNVHLSSLGGAKKLSVAGKLTVDDVRGLQKIYFGPTGCTLTLDAKQLAKGCVIDLCKAETFTLVSTTNVTDKDLEHLRIRQFGRTWKARAVKLDSQAESTNIEKGAQVE